MKVSSAAVRGVSMMYATIVGNELASESVMMAPLADQVKISICPYVSSRMQGTVSLLASASTWLSGREQRQEMEVP